MDYRLIRSRRKTIAIQVDRDGGLEVRAPLRLSQAAIDRFVDAKKDWITEKRALALERVQRRTEFHPEIGSRLPLLGKEFPICPGKVTDFTGEAFQVRPDKEVMPQLIQIFREIARAYLTKRTAYFADFVGVFPTSLRITGASTRFGSCSGRNGICFTWKLVMAEPLLVDYVVVHELCHIRQHNHSKLFWAEVERILPDYREREVRLKAFGHQLQEQNWQSD